MSKKHERETYQLAREYLEAEGATVGERGRNGRNHLFVSFTVCGVPGRLNMPATPSDHRANANLRKTVKRLCQKKRQESTTMG